MKLLCDVTLHTNKDSSNTRTMNYYANVYLSNDKLNMSSIIMLLYPLLCFLSLSWHKLTNMDTMQNYDI
jgi:hypothetical protein